MHTSGVCARDIASKFCVSRGLVHQTIHRWRRGELEVTRFRDDLASVAGAVGR
jgi:transposase